MDLIFENIAANCLLFLKILLLKKNLMPSHNMNQLYKDDFFIDKLRYFVHIN